MFAKLCVRSPWSSEWAPRASDPTGPKWREGCARGLRATVSCETSFEIENRRSFRAVRVIKNDARVWDHLELWCQQEQRKLILASKKQNKLTGRINRKRKKQEQKEQEQTNKNTTWIFPSFCFSYVSFGFLVFWFVFFCLLGLCFCFALYF